MKIDFNSPIRTLDGEIAQEQGSNEGITLKTLAINALISVLLDQRGQPEQLSGIEKVKNATLAQLIYTASDSVDLKVEEIHLIKERIGKAYGPLMVMRAWEILDPPALDKSLPKTGSRQKIS